MFHNSKDIHSKLTWVGISRDRTRRARVRKAAVLPRPPTIAHLPIELRVSTFVNIGGPLSYVKKHILVLTLYTNTPYATLECETRALSASSHMRPFYNLICLYQELVVK